MNELQRQAYLKAMGIDVYFPRVVLDGAGDSPDYELSPIEHDPETEVHAQPPETDDPEVDASAEHPVAEVTMESVVEEPESSPVEENELRFSLRYYAVNKNLAVIDEVPYMQGRNNNVATTNLLKAILRALNTDHSLCSFEPESFDWPLVEDALGEGDQESMAKNALNGFIRKRHELDGFENVIVFCARAEALFGQGQGSESHDFEFPQLEFRITVTKSLQTLLSVPLLKRMVWQELQPVRKRLNAS